jgi:diacylglycerol kinase
VLDDGRGLLAGAARAKTMAAIALFLVAVVLVIVGTYLMFLSGSIAC